ncbi:hypothetical protein XELAEV_18045809mg, partial [Xenopus laevis]
LSVFHWGSVGCSCMMLPLVLLVLGLFTDWGMALKCNTLIEGRKEVTECPPGQKICMTHSISNNNRTGEYDFM